MFYFLVSIFSIYGAFKLSSIFLFFFSKSIEYDQVTYCFVIAVLAFRGEHVLSIVLRNCVFF